MIFKNPIFEKGLINSKWLWDQYFYNVFTFTLWWPLKGLPTYDTFTSYTSTYLTTVGSVDIFVNLFKELRVIQDMVDVTYSALSLYRWLGLFHKWDDNTISGDILVVDLPNK